MRMRNKPWVNDYLTGYQGRYLIEAAALSQTLTKQLANRQLRVEIGSGKGDYLIAMAAAYPEVMWVGIEKERNCAAMLLKKLEECQLDNVVLVINDAQAIASWFAPQSIDTLYLNFSDPWPKKRNMKRRLTAAAFIDSYRLILKDEGELIMKTDNRKLFEFTLIAMQDAWLINAIDLDFRSMEQTDPYTEYERRFVAEGKPIYRACWRKRIV